jgi:hypothetical protein
MARQPATSQRRLKKTQENMKHFYFDITMDVVEYFTMDERNHLSESTKLKMAFTFQIPVPQTDNFLNLIIETELDIAQDKMRFNDFNVRLYSRTKLKPVEDSKYSSKKINSTSFMNYLIKMNNEQILPFMEKNLLGKKISLIIKGEKVDFELSYTAKHDIKKSYQETFSELLECINDTEKKTTYGPTFTPLHNALKDYETERLFNKMNKKLKKDEPTNVKIKKI